MWFSAYLAWVSNFPIRRYVGKLHSYCVPWNTESNCLNWFISVMNRFIHIMENRFSFVLNRSISNPVNRFRFVLNRFISIAVNRFMTAWIDSVRCYGKVSSISFTSLFLKPRYILIWSSLTCNTDFRNKAFSRLLIPRISYENHHDY